MRGRQGMLAALAAAIALGAAAPAAEAGPVLVFEPRSYDFGAVAVGTEGTQRTLTLFNRGDATTTVNAVVPHGTGYAKLSDGCTGKPLAPNASCAVQIGFKPTKEGTFNGTVGADSRTSDARAYLTAKGVKTADEPFSRIVGCQLKRKGRELVCKADVAGGANEWTGRFSRGGTTIARKRITAGTERIRFVMKLKRRPKAGRYEFSVGADGARGSKLALRVDSSGRMRSA